MIEKVDAWLGNFYFLTVLGLAVLAQLASDLFPEFFIIEFIPVLLIGMICGLVLSGLVTDVHPDTRSLAYIAIPIWVVLMVVMYLTMRNDTFYWGLSIGSVVGFFSRFIDRSPQAKLFLI